MSSSAAHQTAAAAAPAEEAVAEHGPFPIEQLQV
jgi:DNA repair protein RAD51